VERAAFLLREVFEYGNEEIASIAGKSEVHQGIRGSELVVFEESSHMSQGEEPEKVLGLVRRFLSRVERTPR